MTLIDVEEMLKSFEEYYKKNGYDPRELHFSLHDMRMNFNKKEVKAIPIEWLKEWDKKHGDLWNIGYTITYIIKDWESDNEKSKND